MNSGIANDTDRGLGPSNLGATDPAVGIGANGIGTQALAGNSVITCRDVKSILPNKFALNSKFHFRRRTDPNGGIGGTQLKKGPSRDRWLSPHQQVSFAYQCFARTTPSSSKKMTFAKRSASLLL